MTFFRFIKHKLQGDSQNVWDGLKPPKTTISSIYYDVKWHLILYNNDQLPLSRKISFCLLKVVQIISYSWGWTVGEKELDQR